MPSSTAMVFRVAYRRDNWRPDIWKNKLFNSEVAARNYAAKLLLPQKPGSKFADLAPVALRMSYGVTEWRPLPPLETDAPEASDTPEPAGTPTSTELHSWRLFVGNGIADPYRLPTPEEWATWVELQ